MIKPNYENFFGTAKAVANLIPLAMENGAESEDIKQAAWGIANLIEMGWTDVDEQFQEAVQKGAAALAAERAARELSE